MSEVKKDNKKGKWKTDKSRAKKQYKKKRSTRFQDIETLDRRIAIETPSQSVYYYKYLEGHEEKESRKKTVEEEEVVGSKKFVKTNDTRKVKIRFKDLPISNYTSKGLQNAEYTKMTEVQRCAIPHALKGRDLMISSRTGSGKTLAYLVPLVEKLYRQRWSSLDGLGGLIIVPVRELAIQAFEVLRSFAGLHDLSAGMIIGGKLVQVEKNHIASMNILVATPGRLLQHMNETPLFDYDNLQTLVLDEVDRMLDMGFAEELSQIMRNLPMGRTQTLLFSATAKKSLQKLAKNVLKTDFTYFCMNSYDSAASIMTGEKDAAEEMKEEGSAKDPKYITPLKLTHKYVCIEAEHKLDTLFSFMKSHKEAKCIVFFSSCKQVRHAYESFSKLKTGASIMEIHGRQKQIKRTAIYFEFVERKSCYLFATDIASRGLDFPAVDWVIQVDIPEDTDTYIHRSGRTARYKYKGTALVMVQPHEMKFVEKLEQMNIEMKKLKTNPNRTLSVTSALQRINAENSDLMHLAQKAFICYIRSVFKNGDREIYDVKKINHEAYAASLGLATTPIIEFVEGDDKKSRKSKIQKLREKAKLKKLEKQMQEMEREQEIKEAEGDEEDIEFQDQESDEDLSQQDQEDSLDDEQEQQQEEDDDDLFVFKRKIAPDDDLENEPEKFETKTKFSKNSLKKIKKGGVSQGQNKVFLDKDGKPISSLEYHIQQDTIKLKTEDDLDDNVKPEDYFNKLKSDLDKNKGLDNQIALDRLKQKRIKRKRQRQEREQLKEAAKYESASEEFEEEDTHKRAKYNEE
ncbi:unnamed protein product [Moneuplotes crassus]|uniref:ATP-dependent RNA helicase n=1 Tax=Euplotes crassus TaxID=5936 RepID=A0AAD1Y743_EUPCR|nr:unnamed protein product [Moneuplotes crassus]